MKSIKTSVVLFLAILIAMPLSCMALSCRPDKKERPSYKGKSSVFIPYANAKTNADLKGSPTIAVGFNGDPNTHRLIMDTGSCGISVSYDIFTPDPDAVNLGPGVTHYTDGSVSKTLTGTYWTATQQFYDSDANGRRRLLATASVPVLQITSEPGFALVGIGFGREGYVKGGINVDSPLKTPAYNAFLNLTSVRIKGQLKPLPKDWTNGYIVSANGVELGLTRKNTKKAGFIKLQYWKQFSTPCLPEWMPMPMTIRINGVSYDGGMSVMDTGIGNAIVNLLPDNTSLGTLINCPGTSTPGCVGNGVEINVFYPNEDKPVASYSFITGQTSNPMVPDSVAVQTRPTTYWNTSRHFLGGMNFIYDNTNGYAGFIWNGNASREDGFVIPTKSKWTRHLEK